jgi:hypothetical protein
VPHGFSHDPVNHRKQQPANGSTLSRGQASDWRLENKNGTSGASLDETAPLCRL